MPDSVASPDAIRPSSGNLTPIAHRPLSGGNPHVEIEDMPEALKEASHAAHSALSSTNPWKLGKDLTATAIVSGIAVLLIYTVVGMMKEDRKSHREDMMLMHDDSNKKWESLKESVGAIKENQAALISLATLVRDSQEANKTLTGAVKDLTNEVRKNTTEFRKRFPLAAPMLDDNQGFNIPSVAPDKVPEKKDPEKSGSIGHPCGVQHVS